MAHRDFDPLGTGLRLRSVIWGLVALAVFGPALVHLVFSLLPAVLLVGVVVAGLRALWFLTGRW